jgi:hypothetical protein
MVGTTRFELATSPTPRVRSTRLSHVPTYYICARLMKGAGCFKYTAIRGRGYSVGKGRP